MKKGLILPFLLAVFILANEELHAQYPDKKIELSFGAGYFATQLDHEGVIRSDATFAPEVGPGFSYFASVDYRLNEKFAIGLGFNGNYAQGEFIQNAIIDNQIVNGYLKAGAIANSHLLVNLTYAPQGDGFRPYGKLGLGFFSLQVEQGDVPLSLTDGVEVEMFPDYKGSGFGLLPELGAQYNAFSLSFAYSLPFVELTGEEVSGDFESPGTVTSGGFQINLGYRLALR